MAGYTPTTADVRNAWWRDQCPKHDLDFDDIYNAAFDRWLQMVKAEVWDEAYQAGTNDQSECEGHTYRDTPEMRAKGYDHWTTNPYRGEPNV